jgi:hypothetical protein
MKLKQTIKALAFSLGVTVTAVSFTNYMSPAVGAIDEPKKGINSESSTTSDSTTPDGSNPDPCTNSGDSGCCGGVATGIINCSEPGSDSDIQQTGLWGVLLLVINIMSAGVGVLAVAGIVYASIMYTSAGGNAEQTKKAMGIITNVVIGVLAFALMFAVLNFLVPGGLFTAK